MILRTRSGSHASARCRRRAPPLAGLELRFVRQPEPDGSADAVRRALAGGAELPAIVSAADTVFQPGDVGHFGEEFESSGAAGALAYKSFPGTARVRIEDGLVRR